MPPAHTPCKCDPGNAIGLLPGQESGHWNKALAMSFSENGGSGPHLCTDQPSSFEGCLFMLSQLPLLCRSTFFYFMPHVCVSRKVK